jgi:glycosyltransferase 2 family protein
MSSRLKAIAQYLLIFGVTVLLVLFSLKGIQVGENENKWDFLLKTWGAADKTWLLTMAFIAMISHVLRAERWRMLMATSGHQVKLADSFFSLMVGYLVNLVVPRGGEVSRCYNLYRLDKTPVERSFGTVVIERLVDVVCLLILIAVAFIVESKKLFAFIKTLPFSSGSDSSRFMTASVVIASVVVIYFIARWMIRRNSKVSEFLTQKWRGFKEGLLSVFRLENKSLFIFYSVSIWFLYFLMSYTVIKAFPETNHLGFSAVISLFAIGSIAMAAPLPGGTGSYHVLVPQGLVFLYAITERDATAFTFIFHGWQTAIMIVAGAVSMIATSIVVKRRNARRH